MTTTLPTNIISRLSTTGATSGWVGDRLGISWRRATKVLRAAGAINTHGLWFMPGVGRSPADIGRQCVPSERTGVAFGGARDAV